MSISDAHSALETNLASGRYSPLPELILDKFGTLIGRITRSPKARSIWVDAFLFSLTLALTTLIIALGIERDNVDYSRTEWTHLLIVRPIWVFIFFLVSKIGIDTFFDSLQHEIVRNMDQESDITNLDTALLSMSKTRPAIFFATAFSLALAAFTNTTTWSIQEFGSLPFSWIFSQFITNFIIGSGALLFFQYFGLSIKFGQFSYRLFPGNPKSSELVESLNKLSYKNIFLCALALASITLVATLSGALTLESSFLIVIVGWIPLTALFVVNQSTLGTIIKRAKRKILNQIQTIIEDHINNMNISNKEDFETYERLMGYHDRIEKLPDSAFNLKVGLDFINSLLLPLFGFVIGNWSFLYDLFR